MRLGAILFLVLVVMTVVGVVLQVREQRNRRGANDTLERVDAFLCAWAAHGDWNAALSAELKRILRDHGKS